MAYLNFTKSEKAFLITPTKPYEFGELIEHQYGCAYCRQLVVNPGRAELLPHDTAEVFAELLATCDYATPEAVSHATGFDVVATDEALATLRDGRYVATENCD